MLIDEKFKMEVAVELCKSNVQITTMKFGPERAVASSVFLVYKGVYFLLSSGHTFEKFSDEDLGFNIGGMWHRLSVYSLPHYTVPDSNMHPDCALFVLGPPAVKALTSSYKAITIFEKDFKVLISTPEYFTFVGYPGNKTKYYPNLGEIGRKPYSVWMNRQTNYLEIFKGEFDCELFSFPFNRYETTKGEEKRKEIFPQPQGISGSGLFSISVGLATWDYKLIGIINAYPEKEDKIIGYFLANARLMFEHIVNLVEDAKRILNEKIGEDH
jgi:hypothetical protein